MRVTKVSATLRYSTETQGAWRSIEMGAEASLTSSDEQWETCQEHLYQDLRRQLAKMWANGTTKVDHPEPAQELNHWCAEHQAEFKAKNGPHGEFYSHRINGTNGWCNEPRAAG